MFVNKTGKTREEKLFKCCHYSKYATRKDLLDIFTVLLLI